MNDFDINLMFPDEYRDFIAEIVYKSEWVCNVTQEEGPLNFNIELGNCSKPFSLEGFTRALEHAQSRLRDLSEKVSD
jgi:hypothetical protein